MNDTHCIAFLQWALPRLGMRWAGFRQVRRQVCSRARRRARELGPPDLTAYLAYLETHPEEWAALDQLTPITISHFHRDRGVFEHVAREVFPPLAARAINRGSDSLDIWSAGCASGEEPYTVAILWEAELTDRFPSLPIRILATDTDAAMLARAHRACYPASPAAGGRGAARSRARRDRCAATRRPGNRRAHHRGQTVSARHPSPHRETRAQSAPR